MSLELKGITKKFGDLIANDGIDLRVNDGEIHAILGENGAGKSTLMNIVYGLLSPDTGTISVDDKEITIDSPLDALAAGIGMVHQHFMLIPVFTVAENIVLGHEKIKGAGFLDLESARAEISRVSREFNLEVDPDAIIENLPVGIQQRVEIIRALIYEARVLILDEPTAVLTPQETDELLDILKQLKQQGSSIVFITHKLREVRAVADKVTIIRRGRVVGTADPSSSQEELASLMVGRPVSLDITKAESRVSDVVLGLENLSVFDSSGRALVNDVSLDVRGGEVFAVAGVQGNGQSELAEAMLGLQNHIQGSITLDGAEISHHSVKDNLDAGIAFIPESREHDGLIGSFSIEENLILDVHDKAPFAVRSVIDQGVVSANAEKLIKEFDIRTQDALNTASSLSGGNKQKVVLARELSRPVKLVIASQPTRGLDVGSIEFVHERIIAERDAGRGVVLFSTELDEVIKLADRIAVMYKGRIIAIVPPDTSREKLGLLMAGVQ